MSYNSKYTGEQVEEYLDRIANGELGGITEEADPIFSASPAAGITTEQIAEWNEKQDAITDLATIRSGAEKGATAVQPTSLANVNTASVSLVLTPNTIYNCTSALTDITISSFNTTSEGYEEYMVLFKSGGAMTLSLPSNVYWANGEKPDIDADTEYELSISKRLVDGANIFKAILVPFKTIE